MSPRVRLRPEIASMVPYRQGRSAAEDAFKLSSNENPFPPLPEVLAAITEASINRYPEGSAAVLRARIAERFGVSAEQVQVGAGSVSVLAQLIQAASGPGDEVIYAWRSFEAYPLLVAHRGFDRDRGAAHRRRPSRPPGDGRGHHRPHSRRDRVQPEQPHEHDRDA